ncbi:MAG TPA: alpha/beta hydrolase [Acidimicrobiia bacterium]|jgi:pimeloyl-ACP methyl ester carboxylesterase|nr:alpha/beta hydrolase [Acidimicrobiia bacterium]HEV3452898.1 alpha/beta hydrolase [Acidimicrobiia bacterium]
MTEPARYDEFGLFHENAEEYGIPWAGPPTVRRESVPVTADGRRLSALVWGDAAPELVLLHGGAQNAHTWDTVALALQRPLVAVDLPGHGHSDHREEGPFGPRLNAADVAVAVRALAPQARLVVGMSLGGLTAIALTSEAPDLVRRLALVDVTPGVDREKAAPIAQFIAGPESFASFDEILARTIEFNPTRSESSLRRGVLHNAVARDDGRWVWRYQRPRILERDTLEIPADFATLWDDVSRIAVPLLLVRGGAPGSVVDDDDVAELRRRQPDARVEVVDGAGHSVQGDRPVELARLLEGFLDV